MMLSDILVSNFIRVRNNTQIKCRITPSDPLTGVKGPTSSSNYAPPPSHETINLLYNSQTIVGQDEANRSSLNYDDEEKK
jgi:hypothetical protein